MRAPLWVLCACACACAADRRTRPPPAPFVADALGQRLPAGAGAGGGGGGGGAPGPAVGSPGALLAPDRYEFYTFDESGELVKRLMTLDEIQAIVAAGDEAEGVLRPPHGAGAMGAPPPPPHTVVHRVVASVQSVLQAQLEAHRTRPPHAPAHPLDTPDVSATWSQILPSVFGNTGQAIAPDPAHAHAHSPHTTPDTELKEAADTALAAGDAGDAATPAGSDTDTATAGVTQTLSTTARVTTSRPPPSASPTRPTTTARPTTTTRPTTRPPPPPTHYTTPGPTTRVQPVSSTTPRPPTTPKATTPRTTTPPTSRPRPPPSRPPPPTPTPAEHRVRVTPRPTTAPPHSTASEQPTHKPTHKHSADNFTRVQTVSPSSASTAARPAHYDKLSTLSPPSTAPHTDRAPQKRPQPPTSPATTVSSAPPTRRPVAPPSASPGQPPPPTTTTPVASPPPAPVQRVPRPPPAPPTPAAPPPAQPPSTTFKPPATTSGNMLSTLKEAGAGVNATAVTTQSVSPATAAPRPEPSPAPSPTPAPAPAVKDGEPEIPLFDVAQSISQIASDLGNYRPSPTPNDLLLDTTVLSDLGAESKENLEIEIPPDVEKGIDTKPSDATDKNPNVFVQISTLDPHSSNDKVVAGVKEAPSKTGNVPVTTIKADLIASTPIDPVLSESMDDLLSQVVHQAPQSLVDTNQTHSTGAQHSTTERNGETTTKLNLKPNATKNNSFVPEINTPTKNTEFLSKNDIEESKVPTTIKIAQISPLKPLDQNDIKIQNKESVENVDKNENYVQISKSTYKNNSKSDSDAIKSTFSSGVNTSHAKDRDEQVQSTKEPTFAKHDKQSISNSDGQIENNKFLNTQESPSAAPPRRDDSGALKKIPNTPSQSVNKIISAENNKIIHSTERGPAPAPAPAPEARPKVEEFKKKIQKVNIDEKELANDRNTSWKLIPAVAPPPPSPAPALAPAPAPAPARDVVLAAASEHQGLDATPAGRGEDEARFTELCNELAFEYWRAMSGDREPGRSFVMSPYAVTSALALVFMGARGATAGELNDLLRLDDMVTFNPHAALRNVSESIACGPAAGVRVAAFVRELLAERAAAGAVRAAFRDRAQRFYDAHVEEVDFALIGDVVRRRTNLLVRRHTHGLVAEYLKDNAIAPRPPLAALSVNIFQTDCSESSVEGRDGEMYFAVSPGVRQRRLVPVPAAVYRRGFLAGYDPALDATAAALGPASATLSTVLLMPGQQGNAVRADDLAALERRLLSAGGGGPVLAWRRALRTLLPRLGLELQVPRFAHRSVVNATRALRRLGLRALFEAGRADLAGLAGARVHLADVLQDTSFATCGEGGGALGPRHHVEEYPAPGEAAAGRREARGADGWPGPGDYQRAFHDPHDAGLAARLPLHLRPRQARLPSAPPAPGPGPAPPAPAPARLKFDRPFLYLVRHNPTGMVLYMGRHDPRLMP